ncbi:MAG: hypothetical protein GXP05_08570 [Alphaproteobacteria bacterium]|nr:hypothetical protein [Alphaproteobacteria bacterium]
MADITILVTCLGGGLSAQFVKLLKSSTRHNIRVVGADMSRDPVARYFSDEFETIPAGSELGYSDAVAEICRRYEVNLVFPSADEEALALASAISEFDALGVTLACNSLPVLELITNKISTYRRLADLAIPMPVWREAAGPDALENGLDEVLVQCGQAVVKCPSGRGGRGIFVINPELTEVESRPGSHELHMNRDAFLTGPARELEWATPMLVMERLSDPVHDLDILAWKGKALTLIPRRRRSSTAPNEGHIIIDAPELVDMGRKIVSELELSWLFDIDIMMDGKGRPIVLEVNPRASGSVAVGMAAGVPLMDDLVSLALGEEVGQREAPVGKQIVAFNSLGAV